MFGIVIFYPAGQPIRNRSGAEKVPHARSTLLRRISLAPEYVRSPWGWSEQREGTPKKDMTFVMSFF